MLFFADDACLLSNHVPSSKQKVQGLLQQDLNEIYKYGEEWMIKFNTNKTIQQHFTYRKQKFVPNLKFGLTPIPVKTKNTNI